MQRNNALFLEKKLQKNIVVVHVSLEGTSTHIIIIYKHILSRNLDQNMLKMLYFLEKAGKIATALGGSAPKPPLASGGWGSVPRPPNCVIPTQITCCF